MWAFGHGPDPYALQPNAALSLDTWWLGPAHLYHGEHVDGARFAFDSEGVLSTLPTACLLIAAGFLWSEWFGLPINKKLWTSSYTLYAGGWSMLVYRRPPS